jgi:uncharacterized protein
MIQFNIYALDYTDADALNRRMAVRPAHFEGIQKLKDNNNYIIGGALLDDAGKMIGSSLIVQFETEAAFYDYLKVEPYILGIVWGNITIRKMKIAGFN